MKMLTSSLFSLFLFCLHSLISHASSQVLVLSGGDNPGLNHYSQYLQTKTLYEFLLNQYDHHTVSLYFGAGNSPQHQPLPLDVHRKINTAQHKHDKTDLMLTGTINHNQPATKGAVSAYFLSPHIRALKPTDNLFLFISDHGLANEFLDDKNADLYSNNCIDLWHYEKPFVNNFTNENDFHKACLSMNELSTLLAQVPAQHIVFEMSQCFSGGFHQLSVSLKGGYPTALSKICGFSAAMPDHTASGCTADADGATYKGYERSFTEAYTGIDIPTGKKVKEPLNNIFAAHQKAILDDMTVDIPISTSDYYLLLWADYFMKDQFTSRVPNVNAEAVKRIFRDYRLALKSIHNTDLKQFVSLANANQKNMIAILPLAKTFADLSIESQAKEIATLEEGIKEQEDALHAMWTGMMNLYLNVINPPWQQALAHHAIDQMPDKHYQFEQQFYQAIIQQGLYKRPFQLDTYYLQYLSANHNDKDLVDYHKNRLKIIESWARQKQDMTLVNAIDYYRSLYKKQLQLQDSIAEQETNKQFLKRIFTYNKIIAAWVVLINIQDKVALAELQGLLNCEGAA